MKRPDSWWEMLLIAAVALALAAGGLIGIRSVLATHTVQQYYIGHPSNSAQRGVCVMASIDWEGDDAVYCTDDVAKAVEEVAKMNAAIGKGQTK